MKKRADPLEVHKRTSEVLARIRDGHSSQKIQHDLAIEWKLTYRRVRPYITAALKILGEELQAAGPEIRTEALANFTALYDAAMFAGEFGPAVRALEMKARINQLLVEKHEHSVEVSQVERIVRSETPAERVRRIATDLGIAESDVRARIANLRQKALKQ